MTGHISSAAFATRNGVSTKQVTRWCEKGLPHKRESNRLWIAEPDGQKWLRKYDFEGGKREGTPTTQVEWKVRREAAAARREELALAKEMAKTLTAEDFNRLFGDACARVRAKLLNLPPRIAGAVFGAATIQEAQAKVEPLVTEIMEELAAGEDVPDEDEEAA